jgi:hypothetical protein
MNHALCLFYPVEGTDFERLMQETRRFFEQQNIMSLPRGRRLMNHHLKPTHNGNRLIGPLGITEPGSLVYVLCVMRYLAYLQYRFANGGKYCVPNTIERSQYRSYL